VSDERFRAEAQGELCQLISFAVGDEEYGLDLLRVKEVIRVTEITRLPRCPAFVKGIINLRGDVIPILDLRERFGLASREQTAATRVIVVDVDGRLVGLTVDSASQVLRLPASQIEPPPPIIGGLASEYVIGVGKVDGRLIIIINADRVLSGAERSGLGEMVRAIEPAVAAQS
jgi:purine-binding chemotaxis protein CheW